jgi:hypothetical protein
VDQASRPLAARIEAHLGSRDVARVIYGAIIGLALVLALEVHPPTAAVAASTLVATAVAVGLAELYSEIVGAEARTRHAVRRDHLRELAGDALAVVAGAGFPAVFFVLAAVGVLELDAAFTIAKWTGFGLICFYGFVAARLAGAGVLRSLAHSAGVGFVGGVLIALKALLH